MKTASALSLKKCHLGVRSSLLRHLGYLVVSVPSRSSTLSQPPLHMVAFLYHATTAHRMGFFDMSLRVTRASLRDLLMRKVVAEVPCRCIFRPSCHLRTRISHQNNLTRPQRFNVQVASGGILSYRSSSHKAVLAAAQLRKPHEQGWDCQKSFAEPGRHTPMNHDCKSS